MELDQITALAVLVAVIAGLIWGKVRSDVVALAGTAVLLATGTIRPIEVQGAFASPALIALASLFVIAYAMELSGLLDAVIELAARLCVRLGALGLWIVIWLCGGASAFLNNTPIVVLAAPVVRDVAKSMGLSPKRFLIPLSYVAILGGACTLIGTSTNLLVNDMARSAGQPAMGLFEITPVALVVAVAGAVYLALFGTRLLSRRIDGEVDEPVSAMDALKDAAPGSFSLVGDPRVFAQRRPLEPRKAITALVVFVGVVIAAALGWAPIAASAFTGAVLLILLRVISPEDAYKGLKPEILSLIAGMVVVGLSLEVTGLAATVIDSLVTGMRGFEPLLALALLYGLTLLFTEILSNAAVAVLVTPLAVALAERLAVSPKPFLIAIMLAASAAFATPFGYQTNVIVFQMGRYSYMDFIRVGVPLNLLTWLVGVATIPFFFPF
jgi:di/tricarboxylate transporter